MYQIIIKYMIIFIFNKMNIKHKFKINDDSNLNTKTVIR
jgi:hypothetical protein